MRNVNYKLDAKISARVLEMNFKTRRQMSNNYIHVFLLGKT